MVENSELDNTKLTDFGAFQWLVLNTGPEPNPNSNTILNLEPLWHKDWLESQLRLEIPLNIVFLRFHVLSKS